MSRLSGFDSMLATTCHRPKKGPCPWMAYFLGLLGLVMLAVPQAGLAAGSPSVSIKTNYYVVGGTNVTLIRHSMAVARPFAATNAFDAFTYWNVRTDFQFRPTGGSWELHSPRVKASITVTLPRWIPGLPVSPELIQIWSEYVTNLARHEIGHIQFAREAAEEVQRRLETMPRYATAPEAHKAAQAVVNEVIEGFRTQEREYDRQTRHGRTQGAVLRFSRPSGPPGKT